MTLWHILHAISFGTPVAGALAIGSKAGIAGIIVAFVLGLTVGLCSFYGLHEVGYYVYKRSEKIGSDAAQNVITGLLYLGTLFWSLAACAISTYFVRVAISHLPT